MSFQLIGISVVPEGSRYMQWRGHVSTFVEVVIGVNCFGREGEVGEAVIGAVIFSIFRAVDKRCRCRHDLEPSFNW